MAAETYQLTYNGVTIDPVLSWEERTEKVMSSNGLRVLAYRHTLTVEAYFLNTSIADKKTDVDTILDAFRENGLEVKLLQNGTAYRTLSPRATGGVNAFLGGGPFVSFDLPASDIRGAYNVPYRLTFTGQTEPTGASGTTIADTWRDTWEYDKQGRATYTREGELKGTAGTIALDEFEGTDPGAPTDAYELVRRRAQDDEDQTLLRYTWVYEQQHQALATSAADEGCEVTCAVEDGLERWTATGSLKFPLDVEPDVDQVAALLTAHGWPSDVQIVRERSSTDQRGNLVTFDLEGEKAAGGGTSKEGDEEVETGTRELVGDFHVMDANEDDVRQVVGKPEVTITQTGFAVGSDTWPDVPDPAQPAGEEWAVELRVRKGRPVFDPSGAGIRYRIEWTRTLRPLNEVAAGEIMTAVDPTTSPLEGAAASRVLVP